MRVLKFADTEGLTRFVASDAVATVMDEGEGITTIITRDGAYHSTRVPIHLVANAVWFDDGVEKVVLRPPE